MRFLQGKSSIRLVLQHPGDQVEHDALLLAHPADGGVAPVLGEGAAVLRGIACSWNIPIPGQSPVGLEEVGLSAAYQVLRELSEDPSHHRQVLQVVMSLEQRVALVKLEYDAASAPHVAWLRPTHLQDHFGWPIVSGRDNRAVVLPVEGGGPEVDELDPSVPHASDVPLGGGAVLAVPVVGHEQDVLRLQVRVCQMVIMQELDSIAQLV